MLINWPSADGEQQAPSSAQHTGGDLIWGAGGTGGAPPASQRGGSWQVSTGWQSRAGELL